MLLLRFFLYILMINEFFYVAIKFVWRQANLCDKTLAVMLPRSFWLTLLIVMESGGFRLPPKVLQLSFNKLLNIFRFILSSFFIQISRITNKFNYKILSFFVIRASL